MPRSRPTILAALVLALASFARAGGPGAAGAPAASFDAPSFGCPMHPEVRATAAGVCPRCGMALVPMGPAGGPAYPVRLDAMPPAPEAGERVTLRFTVVDPATGAAVREFEPVHEMPFHLFIVGDDLEHYAHEHPAVQPDGALVLETALPAAGSYSLFCDFLPRGGTPQVVRLRLATRGAVLPARPPRAPLRPDGSLVKVVDGIRAALTLEPEVPVAGRPAVLQYRLADAVTGAPVDDLEPYLGAWGHTLVLSDDASEYVHSHPTAMIPAGAPREGLHGGPEVSFNATLRKPGRYRLWTQFKRRGKVATVSFTFDVGRPQYLARWDGSRWTALGDGGDAAVLDGPVRALAVRGRTLFAGGEFRKAGGAPASSVAQWDGSRWRALGEGTDGPVWALLARDDVVYAGGEFSTAGGLPAAGIARWDGAAWRAVGTGVAGDEDAPAAVYALAWHGGRLIAAGRFRRAGGVAACGVAAWDGTRWSPLGEGMRRGDFAGVVRALAVSGRDLYAGGEFLTAGGTTVHNVARWDGERWHPLGAGIQGGLERVTSLAASSSGIVAGGEFTLAGGASALRLASWDGAAWRSLDVATREEVQALAAPGDLYVAGGSFSWAPSGRAQGVLRRGTAGWSEVGGGLGGGAFLAPVLCLAADGGVLYAGGGPFILR